MKCLHCNEAWPKKFKVCPLCGKPLAETNDISTSDINADQSMIATSHGIIISGDVYGDLLGGGAYKIESAKELGQLNESDLRISYLNNLFESIKQLSIARVTPFSTDNIEFLVDLSSIYTAQKILVLRTDFQDRLDLTSENEEHYSVIDYLNQSKQTIILGNPGSGKTTLLNFITLCICGEGLNHPTINIKLLTSPIPPNNDKEEPDVQLWEHGILIPVRISLRDFIVYKLSNDLNGKIQAEHFWNYIAFNLQSIGLERYFLFLQKELIEKGGLILIDGLDEIPDSEEHREDIKKAIEDFSNSLPKCRVVLTSRTYAYQKQSWKIRNFKETLLSPFTRGQIQHFINHWYKFVATHRGIHLYDAEMKAELLIAEISKNSRLFSLAENPLLLTLMVSLHLWRGGNLPEQREELYANAVDLLLSWWEGGKFRINPDGSQDLYQPSIGEFLKIGRDKVLDVLSRLAFIVHSSQIGDVGTGDILERDLVSSLLDIGENPDVKPGRLIEYLSQRVGIIVPKGNKAFTFPHRTFQEYLAACYLTNNDYPDKVAALSIEDPERWREVVLLAGAKAARGTSSALWSLIDTLCYKDIGANKSMLKKDDVWGGFFAGQLLLETPQYIFPNNERKSIILNRVRDWQISIIELYNLAPADRAASGRVLGLIGDSRSGIGVLPQKNVPDLIWCNIPNGKFFMGSNSDDTMMASSEIPKHQVFLPEFKITKYPITNSQFLSFVADSGYADETLWDEAQKFGIWNEGFFMGNFDSRPRNGPIDYGWPYNISNHPVVGITWYEAMAFCKWLTRELRAKELINNYELITLPSEAQWEKAARGEDGRIFSWGNTPDSNKANYDQTGIGSTCAVGCFANGSSIYNVQDMCGNIREWTISLWGAEFDEADYKYPYITNDERENLSAGNNMKRVLRGGTYRNSVQYSRCAYRYKFSPDSKNRRIGFRPILIKTVYHNN